MILRVSQRPEDRYASLAVSSDWKLDVLRTARALVIGAGALGNEVCKNLGMLGVKHITVVDMDEVEVSNLTRSVFFRAADRGKPKAEVLAERVRDLNPDVAVWPVVGPIPRALGLGVVRRADMVFSCLDNRAARLALNLMCHRVGRPWVDGSMEDLDGEVAVYAPGTGGCYRCTLTDTDIQIVTTRFACNHVAAQAAAAGKVPTTSTMGSIIAALQVQEAIKIHQGDLRRSLAGKRLLVNGRVNDFFPVAVDARPGCEAHESYGTVTEVPEWTAAGTTGREVLDRFRADTGTVGELCLGFDLVVGLTCASCGAAQTWADVERSPVRADRAVCPACGALGNLTGTGWVAGADPWAGLPLTRLSVPPLEVLKVVSETETRWYELTGDLATLPPTIR
ncbi:MAG TPA: ThiF family adenylyltransferase [Gemmata sp.]